MSKKKETLNWTYFDGVLYWLQYVVVSVLYLQAKPNTDDMFCTCVYYFKNRRKEKSNKTQKHFTQNMKNAAALWHASEYK